MTNNTYIDGVFGRWGVDFDNMQPYAWPESLEGENCPMLSKCDIIALAKLMGLEVKCWQVVAHSYKGQEMMSETCYSLGKVESCKGECGPDWIVEVKEKEE